MRVDKSEQSQICDNRLEVLIKSKYKTVRAFADKIGFTESMVNHIIHGRRKLYIWNMNRFAEALDMDIEDFKKEIN